MSIIFANHSYILLEKFTDHVREGNFYLRNLQSKCSKSGGGDVLVILIRVPVNGCDDALKRKNIFIFAIFLLFHVTISGSVLADEFYEDEPCMKVLAYEGNQVSKNGVPPKIQAMASIVMDTESGRVLFEKNGYSRRAMASTTKIMTAIIALEKGNLDDVVTISKRAAGIWGSTIDLKEGQKYKLKELMYGLMLNSGNDAAVAIAEHIGGTVENFVGMMNEKAQELGVKDTSFKSPHGLDAPDHYSTAYDLAVITQYALRNPVFSKIVGTQTTSIPNRGLYNTNEMLGSYPGADGVKTGYTGQAGRCLVASATRDNWRIISVVLGCSTLNQRAQSTSNILDYAFGNYKPYVLSEEGEVVAKLPVVKGIQKDVSVKAVKKIKIPLTSYEIDNLKLQIELPDKIPAPVTAENMIGNVKFYVDDKLIAQSELKAGSGVRRKYVKDYLMDIIREWSRMMLSKAGYL